MSTPQDIRNKRLARLEALAKANTKAESSPDVKEAEKASKIEEIQPPLPKTWSQTPLAPVKPASTKTDQKPLQQQVSLDSWINNEIKRIFKVSLDPLDEDHFYLESLKEDIASNYLTTEDLDGVFISLMFEIGVTTVFDSPLQYLFQVWSTANNSKRLISQTDPNSTLKHDFYIEIMRLSSGYGAISFYESEAFVDGPNINSLIEELKQNSKNYINFWYDILLAVVDNQTEVDFLSATLNAITERFQTIDYTTDSEFHNLLELIEVMVSIKQIALNFCNVSTFHPTNIKAKELELNTILGRILRVSPLLPNIAVLNYSDNMTKSQISSVNESLQASYPITINKMFGVINAIIRSSAESRIAVLTWMSDLVNKSHLRVSEHSNPADLASDSIMLNITLILFKFSLPILRDGSLSKIDKISIDYLNYRNRLVNITEETKINSTIKEFNEHYQDKMYQKDLRLNFISECFYLMLTYMHYGLGGIIVSANKINKIVKQATEQYNQMKDLLEQKMGGSNNPMAQLLMKRLEPMKQRVQKNTALKLSIEMFFYGRNMQLEIFDVIIGSIEFFIRLIDPKHSYHPSMGSFFEALNIPFHNFDDEIEKLDDVDYLRKLAPVPFKYFPELYLEGIINYCHFISKINNNPMFQNEHKLRKLVEFAIVILRCPELVSNPHLKARLTEVLFFGSLPLQSGNGEQDGYMIQIFNEDKVIQKNLLISLLDFYVMVEKTGASSQFYDKFNSRYHISYIVEQLWKYDEFKADLKRISVNLQQFFVRLIARMLNDTTFLMDESLNHLHTIHECQKELSNRASNPNWKPEESEESTSDIEKKLSESERMAKTYVQLSNKTIHLFNLFTKEAPKSFVIVEIVDRLAGMLNYNLQALVGDKCKELKVKDPEVYKFNPKELLFQLCSIYINLSGETEFVSAIARDLRSFDPGNMRKAVLILKKNYKVPSTEWEQKLLKFIDEAEESAKQDADQEMELGEVPDEFLDPLMFTLMKDPVILPASKVSMDKSILRAHLMNDPTDPFNRMPLKLEDVEPDVELKAKITAWVQSKRQKPTDPDGDIRMA